MGVQITKDTSNGRHKLPTAFSKSNCIECVKLNGTLLYYNQKCKATDQQNQNDRI